LFSYNQFTQEFYKQCKCQFKLETAWSNKNERFFIEESEKPIKGTLFGWELFVFLTIWGQRLSAGARLG